MDTNNTEPDFSLNRHSIVIILSKFSEFSQENIFNTSSLGNDTASEINRESCDLFYFVLGGVIGVVVCIVGLFGNFLSLLTIHTIGKSSVTFFLFRSLAIVDTVYLTTYGLVIVASAFMLYLDEIRAYYSVYQYVTYVVFPFSSMALTVTVWITVLLTIHRHIAVCKPLEVPHLSTLRGVKIQLALISLISYAIEIPRYFEHSFETVMHNGHTFIVTLQTELVKSDTYQIAYRTVFLPILRSAIPLLIILILTVKLILTVNGSRKIRSNLVAFKVKDKVKGDNCKETITVVLIIIAVICIVCQTPGMIYPIFRVTMETDSCDDFFYYFSFTGDLLSALRSSLNFFIYYLLVAAFRRHLQRLFCGRRADKRVEPQRSDSYKISLVSNQASTLPVPVSKQS